MSTPERRSDLLSESGFAEFRLKASVAPLVVRACSTDAEDTDPETWEAYAFEFVAHLRGSALDVSATDTAGPSGRHAVQVTFVIPDDGLGEKFRGALADIAATHGLAPYTSWTETEARLRLARW